MPRAGPPAVLCSPSLLAAREQLARQSENRAVTQRLRLVLQQIRYRGEECRAIRSGSASCVITNNSSSLGPDRSRLVARHHASLCGMGKASK
jgi:hypothetical protein